MPDTLRDEGTPPTTAKDVDCNTVPGNMGKLSVTLHVPAAKKTQPEILIVQVRSNHAEAEKLVMDRERLV